MTAMAAKTKIGFWPEDLSEAREHLRGLVDPAFRQSKQYEAVRWFLTNPTSTVAYRGWSNCRLCGCNNGHQDYERAGIVWPSGYLHYLDTHDVRPPNHLIDVALAEYRKHTGREIPPENGVKRYIMVGLVVRPDDAELKVLASADTLAEGVAATRAYNSGTPGGLFIWIDRETGLPGIPKA